jgi:4-amino-4-deoxy-L-arabinose transferase-like glycosyltransferase
MGLANIGYLAGNIKGSMMFNAETPEQQTSFFEQNSRWLKFCLIVLFLLAALIRRDDIRAPGHLIEREYNSAIFARAFYFEDNDSVETWRKNNAFATRETLPLLEPPLTEYLVSLIYRIVGHEEIWYARYLTSIFWLIGGIFMYKIARILLSVDAALLAVGYYLFVPMGIIISRSFQPDSLMMMMFLISLYCIILYFERPSWSWLLLAGSITGITLLLRPLVLFALFCTFIALSIYKKEPGISFINRRFLVFCVLSLVFPIVFYGYGIYLGKFLQGQADLSFRPYLLPRLEFWLGWFNNGADVAEHSALISALFGFFFLRKSIARILVIGLTVGYFIFGVIFTFHIHTHPYYHIQLFPIMGICAASFLLSVGNTVRKLTSGNWWMPVAASMLFALYFSYSDVRSTLYTQVFENPTLDKEIGEIVGHSSRTVFVAYHYGLPLEYYGEFSGLPWPVSIDDPFYRQPDARELSVQERLDALGFTPEYFVITNFELYNRKHQDLQIYLERECSTHLETAGYLIYSSCQTLARK